MNCVKAQTKLTMAKKDPWHRGRFQAQGNGLEKSEPWAQDQPPTVTEGLSFLQKLFHKLSKKEAKEREKAFNKAKKFVEQAGENGGVDAQVSKTFREKKDIRVDLEVIKGRAFTQDKEDNEK